ncbi:unnamed protein product [Cyclocybe aegerita]|uniref:Zn(2)-C6 fungal-type domain-containing protein n=1 Tax=Cyclocybe aegerita TaxID=1973307 RepID=A0A8S0WGN9_CYCAE|nr:unnamed protein product [Cyclocybe aegerita]
MNVDNESSPSGSANSHQEASQKVKKRRLHGACDVCRKRKIKCDSAAMPGNVCTNCQVSNIHCTHDIPRQPKKKDTQQAYIQSLEERLDRMEKFLHTAHPEKDIDHLIGEPEDDDDDMDTSAAVSISPNSHPKFPSPSLSGTKRAAQAPSEDPSEAEDLAHIALSEHLSQLSMEAVEDRFFGQSSGFMFVKHAVAVKTSVTGKGGPVKPSGEYLDGACFRRPLYWDIRPWEKEFSTIRDPAYVFPDDDLLQSLVQIYFEQANTLLPVLHRPTFMRSLARREHLWDPSFGMTVLLVCAVSSRYSDDPRIFTPGDESGLSSGWKYFCQVPIHRNPLLYRSTIHDLQYYTLAIIYLLGTSIPHAAWNILGLGIRYACEKGAHRRKGNASKPTAEDELLKRAFWCLISIDRIMSSFLGRPCAINDEDFDVEYPIECDDEYWETEDPEQAFKQPLGKPCIITAFVCHLKMCEILAFTLRTLYSTKKSKLLTGLIGNEWESRIVAELDSSMNQWKNSLPEFLRWTSDMKDPAFFHQSVCLHATYYYVQMQIHRPFLTKISPLSFPSLAMCTNAARSCCHLLEVALQRGLKPYPNIIMAAFVSGIVILLNLWGSKRSGLIDDPAKEMANVHKCLDVLRVCEKRWHIAGRVADMLAELASLSDYETRYDGDGDTKRQPDQQALRNPGITWPFAASLFQPPREDKDRPETPVAPQSAPHPQAQPQAQAQQPTPSSTPSSNNSGLPSGLLSPSQLPTSSPTNALASPSPYQLDTLASMPANDWDLSNLLMVQMGYVQQAQAQASDPGQQFFDSMNMAMFMPMDLGGSGSGSGMGAGVGVGIGPQAQQAPPMPQRMQSQAQQSQGQGQGQQGQGQGQMHQQMPGQHGQQQRNTAPGLFGYGLPLMQQQQQQQPAFMGQMSSFGMNEEMFSLWSDIPAAFSAEEWDAYVAHMGQQS